METNFETHSYNKLNKLNNYFDIISSFERLFKEEFDKTNIKKCKCHNGLKSEYNINKYCELCGGIGYIGIEKINGLYVCRYCRGFGCHCCKDTGLVDWISHAMGKDMEFKKK